MTDYLVMNRVLYQALNEDEIEGEKSTNRPSRSVSRLSAWGSSISIIAAIFLLGATATAGWYAGRFYSVTHDGGDFNHVHQEGGWPNPIVECKFTLEGCHCQQVVLMSIVVRRIPLQIIANRTYLQKPSAENDEVWDALYPEDHHGVFRWPDEKRRAGFAGFHQMHCVVRLAPCLNTFPNHTTDNLNLYRIHYADISIKKKQSKKLC